MGLRIHITQSEALMCAVVMGTAALEDIFAMIESLARQGAELGARRLLVDLRQVKEDFKFSDHMAIGERATQRLRHFERVASLVAPGRRKGTSEQVAKLHGVQLRVFISEEDARSWLAGPTRAGAASWGQAGIRPEMTHRQLSAARRCFS